MTPAAVSSAEGFAGPARRAVLTALPAFLITAAATAWCWAATGGGLGVFLGPVLLVTLATPILVLAEEPRRRWIAPVGGLLGVCVVWALAALRIDLTGGEWLRCSLVLGSYVFALAGIACVFAAAGLPPAPAGMLTLLIGLAWMTWPVWLSPELTQGLTDWLVPANPLLAINSVVIHLGTWDRASLAYGTLTVLNQDIPYHLPRTIGPAVLLHLLLGAPVLLPVVRSRWKANAPGQPG